MPGHEGKRPKNLVLGISGGVDSTVAGRLAQLAVNQLSDQGEQASFVAMRLPYGEQEDGDDADRALEIARKIQFHQVLFHRRKTASGLTKLKPKHRALFEAIGLPAPAASRL